MIEKIISALKKREEDLAEEFTGKCTADDLVCISKIREVENCQKIVQKVAKEYGEFDVIYKKVCEFEKEYANREDWENVNSCIRLQNLLQYFKKKLKSPYQKGE